jgi:hypothetical protein
MAIQSQLAERPGSCIAVKNYSLTDIPEGTAVLWDLLNVDPTLPQGIVVPTAAGAVTPVAGVTDEVIYAGKLGKMKVTGEKTCTSDGALAMGAFVQISSAAAKMGRVTTLVGASGGQLGQARNAAADGDPVVIEILIAKSA